MDIRFSITDCNHGFIDYEIAEASKISCLTGDNIIVEQLNCNENDLIEKCKESDIIATQRCVITKSVIDQLPKCKVVSRYGVGVDNLDVSYLKLKGIPVVNFPEFCTEEVANHALSMIMYLYRSLDTILNNSNQLENFWGKPDLVENINNASNTVVGVVGYGKIGKRVAERLLACGFKVLAFDPYVTEYAAGVIRQGTLLDLLVQSDIVTLHCCLNEETINLIGDNELSVMKNSSCLINTSRGKVVNNDALIKALIESKISKAFLDVADPEPYPASLAPNLYISPHCAFYSRQSIELLKRSIVKHSLRAYYVIAKIRNTWTESNIN